MKVTAVVLLGLAAATAACSKSDDGDQTAAAVRDSSGRPHISTVCPSSDAKRSAALVGAIENDSADKKAEPVAPMPQFRYPDELSQAGIGGKALADLVVDTAGLVDLNSVAVTESSDSRITEGVCLYLAASRFSPAIEKGAKVRARVRIPFNFQFGPTR